MLSIRRVMNLTWLCVAVAIGSIVFAACGGSGTKYTNGATSIPRSTTSAGASTTPGAGATVKVTLKEWTLTPDKASVPAGEITFSATNSGTVDHEFVVFKTDLAPDALKLSGDAVDEAASGQTKVDEIAEFAPGTTKTLTLNLQPGKYVLICNVAGHYQRGVSSAFTVTAAAATGRNY
jgi:uncharacterized cupredoxin-like copper-binding protein